MEYLIWLEGLRNDVLNSVLMTVTDFITSPVVYVAVALLYWCFNKRAAYFICMNIAGGSMVNQLLKNTFCVYRPWIKNPELNPVKEALASATGYSFPSGHTQIAATEFLSVARLQKSRKWLVWLMTVFTLLVMFTRNYLGVHTLQDVIVSLIVAVCVILVNERILNWTDERKNRDWIIFWVGMGLCVAFLAYTTFKPYPIDYTPDGSILVDPSEMIIDCYSAAGSVFGFLIGFIGERHLVGFKTDVSKSTRIIRGSVGSVLLIAYAMLAQDPLEALNPYWGAFAFLALAFIFIMFIYPLIFTICEKHNHR